MMIKFLGGLAVVLTLGQSPAFAGAFYDTIAGHHGQGTATIEAAGDGALTLTLADFEVTPGPDLEVWLVKSAGITDADQVLNGEWISLGALKSATGTQSYAVPAEAKDFGAVVIWCKSFSVLFAAADLTN